MLIQSALHMTVTVMGLLSLSPATKAGAFATSAESPFPTPQRFRLLAGTHVFRSSNFDEAVIHLYLSLYKRFRTLSTGPIV